MALGNSDCTVAILTYNGEQWLKKFLPYVEAYSEGAEILVYDNASTDGSVAFVRTEHSQIRLVAGEHNLGFCEGYNEAFKSIETPFAVLLNSDVEVTQGWLTPLIDELRTDETVAAVQPKIKSYFQRNFFEYAGAAGGFLDRFGYPFCRGRIFQTLEEDSGQYDSALDVFWASGACMGVRTELYKHLGGMDTRFFAHMEEIDWCWRAQRAGHRIRFTPLSVVYHVGGATLGYNSPKKVFLNYRNNLLMLDNNLSGIHKIRVLFVRLVLDGVAALQMLMQGSLSSMLAVLRAHASFYSMLGKRSSINTKQQVELSPLSIVWAYFAKSKKRFSELGL